MGERYNAVCGSWRMGYPGQHGVVSVLLAVQEAHFVYLENQHHSQQ
jgi:hypothetical protein